MNDRWNLLEQELDQIKESGLWRFERTLDRSLRHPEVALDGKPVIDFSSNHYLGLGSHPAVVKALVEGAQQYGAGGLASRLIGGTMPPHKILEAKIASFKQTEDAVVFGSGFLANVGAIAALVGSGDVVFSDALNHASLIDGCRLSRAQVVVYPHRDHKALALLLPQHQKARRRLIVTDSVFSMDGDLAPLEELSRLSAVYDAFLYLDEAHATGVYGPQGRGLAASLGITPDLSMGTLSKALGCAGAFVAGSKMLCDFLRNRARSYIFTTAMPPAIASSAVESIRVCAEADERRERLKQNNEFFRRELAWLELHPPIDSVAPIIPLIVGDAEKTMAVSATLLEKGIFAHGIRPPTVPEGTGRLRFTLLSSHTQHHLESALRVLRAYRALFLQK